MTIAHPEKGIYLSNKEKLSDMYYGIFFFFFLSKDIYIFFSLLSDGNY